MAISKAELRAQRATLKANKRNPLVNKAKAADPNAKIRSNAIQFPNEMRRKVAAPRVEREFYVRMGATMRGANLTFLDRSPPEKVMPRHLGLKAAGCFECANVPTNSAPEWVAPPTSYENRTDENQ